MKRFDNTERLGVTVVEQFFLTEGWIPRNIYQTDVGIDMEVEICDDGHPTGQLFGVQIKSGESYFTENSGQRVIYRGSLTHLEYWLKHSLPIILVMHNPKSGETIWQKITEERVIRTEKAWKVEIPKHQALVNEYLEEFRQLNKLPLYFQRLQRMAMDKMLMRKVSQGDVIILEVEEWVNKTSGRASISVREMDAKGNEMTLSEGHYLHFGGPESLAVLFPWADFEIDDDYYYDDEHDAFLNEYGIWDWEEKEYAGSYIDWREYRQNMPKIRALYSPGDEVQLYRLFFSLNGLGRSFLLVDTFLNFGSQLRLNL